MANDDGRRKVRPGSLFGGVALAVGATVLVSTAWLSAPESGADPPPGVDAGPLVAVRDSPRHLADQIPSERYYNSVVGGTTAPLAGWPGNRNIGIRPDLDERREGYVVYSLNGQYRMLSTTAGIAAQAPDGVRVRMEIWADGQLLVSQVVDKNTPLPIGDLDVTGVYQLKFLAASEHPPIPGVQPEAVFADPVLR
jgi:hypothetical protein